MLRYSMRGIPVGIGDDKVPMPRIPDSVLDCAIYLYGSRDDAEAGKRIGGTGFLVSTLSTLRQNKPHVYAVTNKHVMAHFPVLRVNTKAGGMDVLETESHEWTIHPSSDLAIIRVLLDISHFRYRHVGEGMFLDSKAIAEHDIGPGDDVYMVGRFVNHEGVQRNLPCVRFGSIAMMPWEPMRHEDGYDQESFAVELKAIPGYSGSPVFVHIPAFTSRPNTNSVASGAKGPWLLGVEWGFIPNNARVLDYLGNALPSNESDRAKKWRVSVNTGMSGVVPAWHISELLHTQKLKDARDAMDREFLATVGEKEPVVSTSKTAESPPVPDNPSHKEDFNRLLGAAVKVPKSDDQTSR